MNIRWRSQFKKDYKQMMKQGKDINKLDYVINELAIPNPLHDKHHSLFTVAQAAYLPLFP